MPILKMHLILFVIFATSFVRALPAAQNYDEVQPSQHDGQPQDDSWPSASPTKSNLVDALQLWPTPPSTPLPSPSSHRGLTRSWGTSSTLTTSTTSSSWGHKAPLYQPKGAEWPDATTVTVTAAKVTVTVTPDGSNWSPNNPASVNHGTCDISGVNSQSSSGNGKASSSSGQASSSQGNGEQSSGSSGSGTYNYGDYPAGLTEPISYDGPMETLAPVVHWNVDTSPPENVIPVPIGHGCPQYYAQGGNTDPNIAHIFGTMTYQFNSPFVNLDYAAHVTGISYSSSSLVITFDSQQAYEYANQHWAAGTILNTHATDCGNEAGKGCYFTVSSINFQSNTLTATCLGTSKGVEDLISYGEAEWGVYAPDRNAYTLNPYGTSTSVSATKSYGPHSSATVFSSVIRPSGSASGFFNGPSFTASPTASGFVSASSSPSGGFGGNPSASSSGSGAFPSASAAASTNSTGNTTQITGFNDANATCKGPVDSKYGLPTACLGDLFDSDLDTALGLFNGTASDFKAWLDELAPGADSGDLEPVSLKLRRSLERRGLFSWIAKKILAPVAKFIAKKVVQAAQLAVKVVKAIQDATTIHGDFTTNLGMQIPKNQAPTDGKVIGSPWGNSVLIKSFGTQQKGDLKTGTTGYLNVFCVDCGAKGNAQLSGKAGFTPFGGFTQAEVGIIIDLDIVLKLGVDAQLLFKKDFKTNLFTIGLPGLDFAIVKIGPMISLDSRVGLEAAGHGRLLAGAEFGLKKAQATLDLISPSKSSKSGWTPYFQPVFQADGEIMLGAELGLPVGVKVGVRVLTWEKSLGLYDEPSIKATAQMAATVGLSSASGFSAGFKTTNGCTGISTQVSWRNRVWIDILGLTNVDLLDSGDNPLTQGCISLPGVSAPATVNGTVTPSVNGTTSASGNGTIVDSQDGEGSDNGEGNDNGEENSGGGDPTDKLRRRKLSLDFPQLLYSRDVNSTTPVTSSGNDTILDITQLVVTNMTTIDYNEIDVKANAYNRTDGYEFTLMVDQDIEYLITSCGNGNVYVQSINEATPDSCSDLWAARDDVTATDGNSRLMHYYNNTMNSVGVSRLRVASEDQLPISAVPVALAPVDLSSDDGGSCSDCAGTNVTAGSANDNAVYFAVDMYENIFFTVVCTYLDNSVPKLFLIEDVDVGLGILMSADVEYSITGGQVDECFLLPLVQGNDDPDTFDSQDKSDETDPDGSVDLDWDDGAAPAASTEIDDADVIGEDTDTNIDVEDPNEGN